MTGLTSIAALKMIIGMPAEVYDVLGFAVAGDGGGGLFYYDSSSTENEDGGIIFIPNGIGSSPGRWKRFYNGTINVKWFGAKGDFDINAGTGTDDSPALQAAINYIESRNIKSLFLDSAAYRIASSIYIRRGGFRLEGTGALLRTEGWDDDDLTSLNEHFGTSLNIDKGVDGIIIDVDAKKPVHFKYIQFLSIGEVRGTKFTTNAIKLICEWYGPILPVIIEYCNFLAFGKAFWIKSPTQYCVAFVDINNNAFSQCDEVVYYDDLVEDDPTQTAGNRNMSWGFKFTENKCSLNSRIIRGCFSKIIVRIEGNDFEFNQNYSDGTTVEYVIDIEIAMATIEFKGNHFESNVSDCVYISSIFANHDATGGLDIKNRVYIKGNNFDGVSSVYKPYTLVGVTIFNYDFYKLFIESCTIEHNSNSSLLYLTPYALGNGTIVKYKGLDYINKSTVINNEVRRSRASLVISDSQSLLIDGIQYSNRTSADAVHGHGQKLDLSEGFGFVKSTFLIDNISESLGFFGDEASFIFTYKDGEGDTIAETRSVKGNFSMSAGKYLILAICPVPEPANPFTELAVSCGINLSSIPNTESVLIGNEYTITAISSLNPRATPIYDNEKKTIPLQGSFFKSQVFVERDSEKIVSIHKSGTIGNLPIGITVTGNLGDFYFTTNKPITTFRPKQFITLNTAEYEIVDIDSVLGRVFVNSPLQSSSIDSPSVTYTPPVILEHDGAIFGIKRLGPTADRPTASTKPLNFVYFDQTLAKFLFWNGGWTLADGTFVG